MPDPTPLDAAVERVLDAVRADAGLRDLLRAARSWGVPPGRFLGRRTVEVVAETDPAGRAVRYVAPPWDLADVALALALDIVEGETCTGCGHRLAESTDPANEGRYRADPPVLCHACTALDQGTQPYREHPHPQALRFAVRLRPAPATREAS